MHRGPPFTRSSAAPEVSCNSDASISGAAETAVDEALDLRAN
jgi:hypothetical protein